MDQSVRDVQIENDLPLEDRLLQLLQHLGIEQAHFAGRGDDDWQGLATAYPNVISSLTLICPSSLNVALLQNMTSRLLVVAGDQSQSADILNKALAQLPEATELKLHNYVGMGWDDHMVERKDEIGSAMMDFIHKMNQVQGVKSVSPAEGPGEVAGITYEIQGSGPPLILLPLFLAPSQWGPLLPKLGEQYCTITLGGPKLGITLGLETRGHSAGYLRMLSNMMDAAQLQAGQAILEMGCGSGVIDRWLARRTGGESRIVGVDINRFLLKEAAALAKQEGLDKVIEFREGNVEQLPMADDEFDITISSTVMEEVDADRMLAEMIRVTKPGGKVGVIVRALDMPWLVNIPLDAALKAKVESPDGTDEGKGCASASLYRRFQGSPLTNIKMMPQLAVFDNANDVIGKSLQRATLSRLSPEETIEWKAAVAKAIAENTFYLTWPHHCAVGTKPG